LSGRPDGGVAAVDPEAAEKIWLDAGIGRKEP